MPVALQARERRGQFLHPVRGQLCQHHACKAAAETAQARVQPVALRRLDGGAQRLDDTRPSAAKKLIKTLAVMPLAPRDLRLHFNACRAYSSARHADSEGDRPCA
jgi:hypothetical protein